METAKISVIIPAFNEAQSIGAIVLKIRALYPEFEVIVIDDGSKDGTAATALAAGAKVYSHPYNIGNGAAVKSGIRAANGDILVFMDGDGQHNPATIETMTSFFPEYDMVVGARVDGGQASVGRAIGNKAYNWLASYVANFKVEDLTSGFRAVKGDIARGFIHMLPNTYSYPSTLTLGALRSGRSLKFIPIKTHKRTTGKSNIKMFQDGIRFFMIITRIATFYSPMRVFLPVSFFMFLMGSIRYAYTFFTQGRFTNMSAIFYVSAVIIFMMSLISEQICQLRFERREIPRTSVKTFTDHDASDEHSENQS